MITTITRILLLGTLLSVVFVMIGGALYLYQSGGESLQTELLQPANLHQTTKQIWQFAFSFSPLGIIQLGLLLLVTTQTIRVALLCWFYTRIHDRHFALISLFILSVLIYSSFWRN